ncbi:hypothetical protein M433DRAFT_176792 [Acidomyces richmondensis BFW]|nr:hypothetical protein M433DRAFT_176792 [Acidomyces richmondensis BFW]
MDIAEWLLNTTQVCVSGACGPRRAQPIECYFPTHQIYSYRTTTTLRSPPRRVLINGVATGVPGGIPREVESSTSDGESGIVFDKDLMSVWRLPQPVAQYDVFFWEKAFEAVLSHNTLLVAIEAFLDDEPGVVDWILKSPIDLQQERLLAVRRLFRDYVSKIGTQPVTMTISSLIQDLVQAYSYNLVEQGVESMLRTPSDLQAFAEGFLSTRECFFCTSIRRPYVQATFQPGRSSDDCMVEIYYHPSQPVVGFDGLSNRGVEGDEYVLKPILNEHRLCQDYIDFRPKIVARYSTAATWLEWDEEKAALTGRIPSWQAAAAGVERLDGYTLLIELSAVHSTRLPAGRAWNTPITSPAKTWRQKENIATGADNSKFRDEQHDLDTEGSPMHI